MRRSTLGSASSGRALISFRICSSYCLAFAMDGTPPLLVNCLFPETHPAFSSGQWGSPISKVGWVATHPAALEEDAKDQGPLFSDHLQDGRGLGKDKILECQKQ